MGVITPIEIDHAETVETHWPNTWKPVGVIARGTIRDLRRQRHVTRLHEMGPRTVDGLLKEIGAEYACMTFIESRLTDWSRLPSIVSEVGGDKFPAIPIREVR